MQIFIYIDCWGLIEFGEGGVFYLGMDNYLSGGINAFYIVDVGWAGKPEGESATKVIKNSISPPKIKI
jgi:hypothetical protein